MSTTTNALLANKLARICVEHGDYCNARLFSSASAEPDFPRCSKCLAPLFAGKTARLKIRAKFTATLSCAVCLEPRAAKLKRAEVKKKAKHVVSAPIPVPAPLPLAVITPKRALPESKTAPLSVLALAEQRMREEKKSARKAKQQQQTTTAGAAAAAPPLAAKPAQNSLSAVAKLLMG